MSDLIGDTRPLTQDIVPFNIVRVLTGPSGSGHFAIPTAQGFKQLASCRASVKIISDTLRCQILGPASASVAPECYVAILPDSVRSWPTAPEEILTIGGSAYCQHSVYSPSRAVPIRFAAEAAHQIKPTPVVGEEPHVAYSYNVVGGDDETKCFLRLSGEMRVDGIGFTQTW